MTPIEMKEIVYQAVAYLGIGRVYPFFHVLNEFLMGQRVMLLLEGQATTHINDCLIKGRQKQVDIFGEHMKDFYC